MEEESQRGEVKFRLTEIESRFTNKIPISDVTLNIAINEEIVAELQLTLQTNFAAYNFAHKVYELARSKIFSKIKITHNYYEEYRRDFEDLVKRYIEIGGSELDGKFLKTFFKIENTHMPDLFGTIGTVFEKSKEKIVPNISVNPTLQFLINFIFSKKMGLTGKELGTKLCYIL